MLTDGGAGPGILRDPLDTATVLAALPSTTNFTEPTAACLVSRATVAVTVTALPFFTDAADAFSFVVDTALTTDTDTAGDVAPTVVAASEGMNCAVIGCLPTFAVCDSFTWPSRDHRHRGQHRRTVLEPDLTRRRPTRSPA